MTDAMKGLLAAAAGVGGLGVYLLLPRGNAPGRQTGVWLAGAGLVLVWIVWAACFRDVSMPAEFVFYLLATLTVVGGVMTVTERNPVSCALSFTCTVIGTAGLFLIQNSQFLAAALVIVYAGAIVVMFLFVIMMAQQAGVATQDRLSREPAFAAGGCFVLLLALMMAIVATYRGDPNRVGEPVLAPSIAIAPQSVSQTALMSNDPSAPQVASLGATLFTEHLLSIEIAGTLLLVAMVGAILIAGRRAPVKEPR